jgi:hypothetical protein
MGRPLNIRKLAGDVTGTGKQLLVKAKVGAAAAGNASLTQQKNQYSFRVTAVTGGAQAICRFVDKATGALLVGEMSLTVTPASGPTFHAKKITNRYVWDFAGNRYMWSFDPVTGKVVAESL